MNLFNLSRRKLRLLGQFLGLFGLCFLLVVSCDNPSGTTGNKSDRIIIGTTLKVRTVDPADAYELASGNLLYNLGDRLYSYAPGTIQLVPQLATELPQVSNDNLTYTIPLRQGVVFHDGTPFNAEAMSFSLRRFMENEGPPSFLLGDVVESIRATGEYELEIKLKQPFAAFPALLAFSGACAVSPQAYEIGSGKFQPNSFVGTGPYKLAELGTDVIRLDVFDQYWGSKPQNTGIDMQIFSSSANLFNAFRTGAIDVAAGSLDADQIKALTARADREGWQSITADSNTLNYMVVNVNSPPLDKVEVRQALAAIIDRKILNQRVLQNQALPVYSLIPTSFDAYKPVFQTAYGDGNAAKAKALLQKAGYSQANPVTIELWYSSNSTKRGVIASTIKAIADRKLDGMMQIELNSVESTTAFDNLDKGVYPTFLLDWYADFFDPDNYIQPFMDCDRGSASTGCQEGASQYHGSFYYSDRVNQLIDQQRQESNPQKRQAMLTEIQEILAREVPFIPLWLDKDYIFAQKNIAGVTIESNLKFPYYNISKLAVDS
ncbi:MAG: ABC transporter substrate-binding protein [Hormoscilla sp.]